MINRLYIVTLSIMLMTVDILAQGSPVVKEHLQTTENNALLLFLLYFVLIPTIILFGISFILLKKNLCVFFYGRKDQMNSFFTFTLPVLIGAITWFVLGLFSVEHTIQKWGSFAVAVGIFLYGFFHLIKNAIIYNDNKLLIPYVIFIKIYFGFYVGIAFALSIFSYSQNMRYQNEKMRSIIVMLRFISLILGGLFILLTNALTTSSDSNESESSGGFDGKIPLGRTVSRL